MIPRLLKESTFTLFSYHKECLIPIPFRILSQDCLTYEGHFCGWETKETFPFEWAGQFSSGSTSQVLWKSVYKWGEIAVRFYQANSWICDFRFWSLLYSLTKILDPGSTAAQQRGDLSAELCKLCTISLTTLISSQIVALISHLYRTYIKSN